MHIASLCELPGTSGNEELVAEYLLKEAKPYIDEHWIDSIGNLIMLKKGQSCSKKVLMLAHMDEVGLMVQSIDRNAYVRFSTIGGIESSVLAAKKVVLHGKEKLEGIIGVKPIHLQGPEEWASPLKKESFYIDTGLSSAEEVKKILQLGDAITFNTPFASHGRLWKGKAFDDRAGCAILLESIQKNISPAYDTFFVFCVQEEVGLRGSQIAGQRIQPDLAFVFEGTTASDIPMVARHRQTTRLNQGPAFTIAHRGLVFEEKLLQRLSGLAQENHVPFQWKEKIAGGNDATSLAKAGTGCPVGSISLPVRYIHAPVSLMSPEDFKATLQLSELIMHHQKLFFTT